MERTFLFTPGRVVNNKVKLKRDTAHGDFTGLCFKNNIRVFYRDITDEFYNIGGNCQADRDLRRQLFAHTDDFSIDDNNVLKIRDRNSSDYTKEYIFENGIFIVYSETFLDVVESHRLEDYMIDFCFDVNEAPKIKKEKALVLSRTTEDIDKYRISLR